MVWQETLLVYQPALRNIKTVDDTLEKIEALDQVQKRKDIRAEEAAVEARQKLLEEKDENAPDLKVRLKIRLALSEEESVYKRMT